jgi:hypothetical protein
MFRPLGHLQVDSKIIIERFIYTGVGSHKGVDTTQDCYYTLYDRTAISNLKREASGSCETLVSAAKHDVTSKNVMLS